MNYKAFLIKQAAGLMKMKRIMDALNRKTMQYDTPIRSEVVDTIENLTGQKLPLSKPMPYRESNIPQLTEAYKQKATRLGSRALFSKDDNQASKRLLGAIASFMPNIGTTPSVRALSNETFIPQRQMILSQINDFGKRDISNTQINVGPKFPDLLEKWYAASHE